MSDKLTSYLKRLIDQQAESAKMFGFLRSEITGIREAITGIHTELQKINAVPEINLDTYMDEAFENLPAWVSEPVENWVPEASVRSVRSVTSTQSSPHVASPASVEASLFSRQTRSSGDDAPEPARKKLKLFSVMPTISKHGITEGVCALCGRDITVSKKGLALECKHVYHYDCAESHFSCVKKTDCPACISE